MLELYLHSTLINNNYNKSLNCTPDNLVHNVKLRSVQLAGLLLHGNLLRLTGTEINKVIGSDALESYLEKKNKAV